MRAGDKFGPEEIKGCIPHRGRNLVVDRIEFFDEDGQLKARSFLTIGLEDGAGRNLFLHRGDSGPMYSEFVLVEHVALTSSVVIAPDTGRGAIAFFSTITNFSAGPAIPAGEPLEAVVTFLGRRGPFFRSRCSIGLAGSAEETRVELMAAVVEDGARMEGDRKAVDPPRIVETRPVDRDLFPHKDPSLVFVDEECALEVETGALVAKYTYPPTHPLVPGHFPGNPVMMGVTQWAGMLDAAIWLAHRLERPSGIHCADGAILRGDGTLITEIRGMEFDTRGDGAPRVLKTKRIGFRDMVTPEEEIFFRVRLRDSD
ncbi:MAG: hypothetical protein ACYS47_09880 [Planctomycetota bacterium]|jgi:3-hydroxymyristoyl/3-hydroxydecanoyl-(acyl carrier protein) dehydratase